MDRARILDLAASEIVEKQREDNRLIAIAGKDAITVSWGSGALEHIPQGQFADRVLAWIGTPGRRPCEVADWAAANREPLRLFWARSPSDALELKKVIEARSRPAEAPGATGGARASALGANHGIEGERRTKGTAFGALTEAVQSGAHIGWESPSQNVYGAEADAGPAEANGTAPEAANVRQGAGVPDPRSGTSHDDADRREDDYGCFDSEAGPDLPDGALTRKPDQSTGGRSVPRGAS